MVLFVKHSFIGVMLVNFLEFLSNWSVSNHTIKTRGLGGQSSISMGSPARRNIDHTQHILQHADNIPHCCIKRNNLVNFQWFWILESPTQNHTTNPFKRKLANGHK